MIFSLAQSLALLRGHRGHGERRFFTGMGEKFIPASPLPLAGEFYFCPVRA